jgi:hypothetical protein
LKGAGHGCFDGHVKIKAKLNATSNVVSLNDFRAKRAASVALAA